MRRCYNCFLVENYSEWGLKKGVASHVLLSLVETTRKIIRAAVIKLIAAFSFVNRMVVALRNLAGRLTSVGAVKTRLDTSNPQEARSTIPKSADYSHSDMGEQGGESCLPYGLLGCRLQPDPNSGVLRMKTQAQKVRLWETPSLHQCVDGQTDSKWGCKTQRLTLTIKGVCNNCSDFSKK